MKILKVIFIMICTVFLFVTIWTVAVEILTAINPNYITLEDGERGYYMNIENMFFALIIGVVITLTVLSLLWSWLKEVVNE